ncbi:MAG: hypothetical protein ACE5H2_05755 [Terriglobia bacterium]
MDDRKTFLLEMYNQMFADINRHIMVVWQSIGVIGGAIALLALAEKKLLPVDYAVAFIVAVCFWSINTIIDSAYWYNRNLVIIANIERQFLGTDDIKEIQFYFAKHRAPRMIKHLFIQFVLVLSILSIFFVYHLFSSVAPGIAQNALSMEAFLPWLVAVLLAAYSVHLWRDRKEPYKNFLRYSPGKDVKSDISSVPGHRTE